MCDICRPPMWILEQGKKVWWLSRCECRWRWTSHFTNLWRASWTSIAQDTRSIAGAGCQLPAFIHDGGIFLDDNSTSPHGHRAPGWAGLGLWKMVGIDMATEGDEDIGPASLCSATSVATRKIRREKSEAYATFGGGGKPAGFRHHTSVCAYGTSPGAPNGY